MSRIKLGRYRHFKGGEYEVIGVARDSETMEEKVVYCALYGARELWLRSVDMFSESVQREGAAVPRFQFIGEMD